MFAISQDGRRHMCLARGFGKKSGKGTAERVMEIIASMI